jgi:hypothetical protein
MTSRTFDVPVTGRPIEKTGARVPANRAAATRAAREAQKHARLIMLQYHRLEQPLAGLGAPWQLPRPGSNAVEGRNLKRRLFVYWVYVKSFFYSFRNLFRKNRSTDRFIYK